MERDDAVELAHRDLSGVADQDLTEEERRELKRRFDAFVTALRASPSGIKAVTKPRPQHAKWDPARHNTGSRSR